MRLYPILDSVKRHIFKRAIFFANTREMKHYLFVLELFDSTERSISRLNANIILSVSYNIHKYNIIRGMCLFLPERDLSLYLRAVKYKKCIVYLGSITL